jgi:hypothetical protein
VSNDGLVVTNYHVIAYGSSAVVKFSTLNIVDKLSATPLGGYLAVMAAISNPTPAPHKAPGPWPIISASGRTK